MADYGYSGSNCNKLVVHTSNTRNKRGETTTMGNCSDKMAIAAIDNVMEKPAALLKAEEKAKKIKDAAEKAGKAAEKAKKAADQLKGGFKMGKKLKNFDVNAEIEKASEKAKSKVDDKIAETKAQVDQEIEDVVDSVKPTALIQVNGDEIEEEKVEEDE